MFTTATLFLIGTSALTTLSSSLRSIHKHGSEKVTNTLNGRFFYRTFHRYFFPENEFEGLFFAVISAQNITRFLFAASSITFALKVQILESSFLSDQTLTYSGLIIWVTCFVLLSLIVGDYIPRVLGTQYPESSVRFSAPLSSLFLLFAFPITYIFLRIARSISLNVYFDHLHEPDSQAKQEIIEMIKEAEFTERLDANEKKLFSSVLSFCDHLTREVMIPRVELFSLEASTTIAEAAKLLDEEGYSRVPIYEDTIDNIVGILMYKDVLAKLLEYQQKNNDETVIQAPVSSIQKPPLYTPETKKISDLLQEFRIKQTHIAIVVDEYGGTEGIITIEDILEDIVGEIVDEYDVEEQLFVSLPNGAWIVDPRMSILDAEEQLGIKVPQEGDYDTIGGYIYHCAGEIPKRGFSIQSDEFEVEVLKTNERTIEKVRVNPRLSEENTLKEGLQEEE